MGRYGNQALNSASRSHNCIEWLRYGLGSRGNIIIIITMFVFYEKHRKWTTYIRNRAGCQKSLSFIGLTGVTAPKSAPRAQSTPATMSKQRCRSNWQLCCQLLRLCLWCGRGVISANHNSQRSYELHSLVLGSLTELTIFVTIHLRHKFATYDEDIRDVRQSYDIFQVVWN